MVQKLKHLKANGLTHRLLKNERFKTVENNTYGEKQGQVFDFAAKRKT